MDRSKVKWSPKLGFTMGNPPGSADIFPNYFRRQEAIARGTMEIMRDMTEERSTTLEQIDAQREILRRRYRHMPDTPGGALFNFTKFCLGHDKLEWDVHGELCRRLEDAYYDRGDIHREGNLRRYMFLVPRGCYKTTIATLSFPIWVWLQNDPSLRFEQNPNAWQPPQSFNGLPGYDQRFLLGQAVEADAKRYLSALKTQLESNTTIHDLFGRLHPEKRSEQLWRADSINVAWRMNFGGVRKEANANVAALDKTLVGGHYDVAILDDMIGEKQVTNEEQAQQTKEWYQRLIPIMMHQEPSLIIFVGTRWHDSDLYGYLQETEGSKWSVYVERAERTEEEIAAGKRRFFFPAMLNEVTLADIRGSMRPYQFSCQYYNDPVEKADGPFSPDLFNDIYYDLPHHDDDQDYETLKAWLRGKAIYTTVDPAIAKEKRSCNAVVVTVAWDHLGIGWVLDLFRKQGVEPDELIGEVFRQNQAWLPLKAGIEEDGFQRIYKWYADRLAEKTGMFPPWEPLKPSRRAKELRIYGLEPLFKNHRIRLRRQMTAIEDEAIRFPRGKYRDALDALAYQLDLALPGVDETPYVLAEMERSENPFKEILDKRLARLNLGKEGNGYVGISDWYND